MLTEHKIVPATWKMPTIWINLTGHALDVIAHVNFWSFSYTHADKATGFCEIGIKLFSCSSVNIFICSKNGNKCKKKCGSYTYRMYILKSLILRNNARESPVHTCHLVQVPPGDVKCLSVNQAASLHPLSYNPNPFWFVLYGRADFLLSRKVSASFLVLFWT